MSDLDDDAADGVTVREVLDKEIAELRQALRRCRAEALEEAAIMAENHAFIAAGAYIAAAIHALKER
jgi:molybdopterin biosynthesis enzyme MoaB